jgi:DNA-binding IscR family transcriptional regulator
MTPAAITLADIADIFADPRPVTERCLIADRPCNALDPCSAHRRWSAVTQRTREPLRTTTIAQLCSDRSPSGVAGRP